MDDHAQLYEFGDRGKQSQEGRPSKLEFNECQEGWIANKTIDVIKQAKKAEKPFIIHTSFPRPHQCTSPCQEFWDLYADRPIHLPPNANWDLSLKAPNLKFKAKQWKSAGCGL